MRRTITDEHFWEHLAGYTQTAWRFEQQRTYDVGYEQRQFSDFLAGQPQPPTENPELGAWMVQVRKQVGEGKSMGRVRIVDDPITDYQRWMRWMDRWNRDAGENILYLSRAYATDAGLWPLADAADFWLFDDRLLMLMHFDEQGVRTSVELLDDEPEVDNARVVRAMAIRAAHDEARKLNREAS